MHTEEVSCRLQISTKKLAVRDLDQVQSRAGLATSEKRSPKMLSWSCDVLMASVTIIDMNTITIPKKIAAQGDFIVVPRKEYEALLKLKKFKEFNPTATQKKALLMAEQNFRKGKTLSYHELVKKLGFGN